MIEQPLGWDDIYAHVALQRQLETPICLDECIHDVEHARAAIEMGACKIINIKLGRVGGHTAARQIHDLCQSKSVPVWCGGMLESGIGRAHNIAMSSLPNFSLPGDVSASRRYWEQDIIEPEVEVSRQGTIRVPSAPESDTRLVSTASNRSRSAARSSSRLERNFRSNFSSTRQARPSSALLMAALLAMLVMWSVNYVAGKTALLHFDPITLVAFRFEAAGVIMLAVYFAQRRRMPLRARDLWTFAYLAFLGVVVNQGLFTIGLNYTTSSHSAIIVAIDPILILVLARAMGIERFTAGKVIGMALAFAGILVLETEHGSAFAVADGRPDFAWRRDRLFDLRRFGETDHPGIRPDRTQYIQLRGSGDSLFAACDPAGDSSRLEERGLAGMGRHVLYGDFQFGAGLFDFLLGAALHGPVARRRDQLSPADPRRHAGERVPGGASDTAFAWRHGTRPRGSLDG